MIHRIIQNLFISGIIVFVAGCMNKTARQPLFAVPMLVGEVSQSSAIFQARLTQTDSLLYGDSYDAASITATDLKGIEGVGYFEISPDPAFAGSFRSGWLKAEPENDFIVRYRAVELKPGTKYYYKLHFGKDSSNLFATGPQSFQTLPEESADATVSFVMITGSNLDAFYLGAGFGKPTTEGATAYTGEDRFSGFPGIRTITSMQPDFFIGNGDNVYYDLPPDLKAVTQEQMRAKWHRQLGMPVMQRLFGTIPTYWLKDDHDHRFDDSDSARFNEKHGELPSHDLGLKTFIEQVPVIDPVSADAKTFRTYRIGNLLQIWMLEGRDYRTPNKEPDGPGKTIWGEEQKKWLKQTLSESNAIFKLLISPTPMIGPDDARKKDNHTNFNGFRHERDEFFSWLKAKGFLEKNFYILCGDRHWQYHSIDPSGFEEFSCGAIVDQNARLGRLPGDPKSTDPDSLIRQPYTQKQASGGFLKVNVIPGENKMAALEFVFYDENGIELYKTVKLQTNR